MEKKEPDKPTRKRIEWVGQTHKKIAALPADVRVTFGDALRQASFGRTSPNAKPMRSIGPGVYYVKDDENGDTYREFYTVHFANYVYVLDVFQKKSKSGISTPKADLDRIKQRYDAARKDHDAKQKAREPG